MDSKTASVLCFLPIIAIVSGSWPPVIPPEFRPEIREGLHHDPPLSSPIPLNSRDVSATVLPPFKINDMITDNQNCFTMKNSGKSLELNVKPDCPTKQTLSGGILETLGDYTLAQLHFHWGGCVNEVGGSEHAVDGIKYPVEAHFVHVNNKYPDLETAQNYSDGVAVMAALVEVIDDEDNPKVAEMVEIIPQVKEAESETTISDQGAMWLMEPLLRHLLSPYFAYPGGLTTSPYVECVTWIVFRRPTSWMSKKQMKAMKTLRDEKGNRIKCNARPLQEINGRPIKLVMSDISDKTPIIKSRKGFGKTPKTPLGKMPSRNPSLDETTFDFGYESSPEPIYVKN